MSLPALEVTGLTKSFGGTAALAGVSLSIAPGEVRALLGENGSGKSTFIKILSGYHEPDSGKVSVSDGVLAAGSPESSYAHGCRFVHQDLGLVESSSVADNLYLASGFPTRFGTVRTRLLLRSARADLARVGLDQIDPLALVGELTPAERTGISVARALRTDRSAPVRLLVIDEATATLPENEVQHFLRMIRQVAASGVAVLYVTHRLDEVFEVADTVSILRDGRLVATEPVKAIDRARLINLLIGSELEDLHHVVETLHSESRVVLEVRGLSGGPLSDVSIEVRAGEIVGIAGITGSGRETILGAIFGAHPREAGEVRVDGVELSPFRPDRAMAAGVGYVPPDRKRLAGIIDFSARENISLSNLSPFWRRLRIRRDYERAESKAWFDRLDVRPSLAIEAPLINFSGGNQQKVILAKWMRRQPAVLLLDEPTQGVDVGAKSHLHRLLVESASAGAGILVSSTDVDELAALCQRVIVLRNGRFATQLSGANLTVANIARECLRAEGQVLEQ